MEKIIIEHSEKFGFKITQGDKYSGKMCYDEMLGLISSLTMPENRPNLHWMRTEEEYEVIKKHHEEIFESLNNNKKRV